ncbi:MAG: SDR family oxidoreductase [Acidobacteriaceae bacterium]|nr:SDR family oxidoreductase [Acidobacteriaceae bacterium]
MKIDFSQKVIAVTGGASGIGEAIVRKLTECGGAVAIADRDEMRGTRIAQELLSATFVQTDVSEEDSVAHFFDRVQAEYGRLDGLVNAAAWLHAGMYRPFLEQPLEEWNRSQQINFQGVVLTSRRALPLLEASRGSIVNISSVGAARVFSNGAGYCSSKAAVEHFTRCLAFEFASRGVRINALAPGYIDTPGVRFATSDQPVLNQVIQQKIPMGRLGQPVEMAHATLFLLSPLASYVTGATLLADGGWALT